MTKTVLGAEAKRSARDSTGEEWVTASLDGIIAIAAVKVSQSDGGRAAQQGVLDQSRNRRLRWGEILQKPTTAAFNWSLIKWDGESAASTVTRPFVLKRDETTAHLPNCLQTRWSYNANTNFLTGICVTTCWRSWGQQPPHILDVWVWSLWLSCPQGVMQHRPTRPHARTYTQPQETYTT